MGKDSRVDESRRQCSSANLVDGCPQWSSMASMDLKLLCPRRALNCMTRNEVGEIVSLDAPAVAAAAIAVWWWVVVPSEVAATAVSVGKVFWLESGSAPGIERGGFPSLITGSTCANSAGDGLLLALSFER